MNPADERVAELLDKWLASLELHLKYVSLDEPDYRKAQPWPDHDRPSRWIIEVAKGKARELRDQVAARIATGDATFCESLELMAFLVNLVGARVDRFIPLAEVASEVDVSTAKQPAVATPAPAPSPPTPPSPPPAAPVIVAAPAPRPAPAVPPPPEQPRAEQQYAPPPAPVFKAPLPVATPTPAAAPPSTSIGPARTVPAIGAAPVVLVAPTLPSAPPAPVIPPPHATPVVQSPPPAPARAVPAPQSAPSPAPAAETTTAVRLTASGEQRALAAALDATREMPRPVVSEPGHASDPDDTVETPRAKTDARKVTRREPKARAPAERATSHRESHAKEKDISTTVIADAVRLIVWGRKWHELVELIGRFAERPSATEIRRILKEHRAAIEKTAEKERSKKKK